MRLLLARIIIFSGMDLASASQVEEANSSEEESRKQIEPKPIITRKPKLEKVTAKSDQKSSKPI